MNLPRLGIALALALAAWSSARGAQPVAEDEGPVFGARKKPPAFSLEPLHGDVEIISQWVSSSDDFSLGGKAKSSAQTMIEALRLETAGYVLSPNFTEFTLMGRVGLQQDTVDGGDQSESNDSTLYEWDARATILRNQPTTLYLFTRRAENLINQTFGPTVKSTNTMYGSDLQIKSKTLPTTFRLYRTEQTQSSLAGEQDFAMNQNVFEWQTEWKISEHQSVIGNFSYSSTDQTSGLDSVTSESTSGSAGHSIQFGPNYLASLSSSVSMSETTGPYGVSTFTWNELLYLRHSRTFETWYNYYLTQQTFGSTEQTQQRADARFRHQLYESLNTTGKIGLTQIDVANTEAGDSSTTSETAFGFIDFAYTKKVPLGRLYADLGLNYTQQNSQARSEAIPVINEPYAFGDFNPIFIRRSDIVASSILIRTPSGRIYSPITDYRIRDFGNYIQIDRVFSGNIHLNDPLLLNYELQPEPANTVTSEALNISLRYDIERGPLKGLSPFVQYFMQDQSVSASGPNTLVADSVRDLIVGAEYRVWELTLRGEYERRDTTILPFDAYRLRGRLDHRFGFDTALGVNVEYQSIHYFEPANQANTMSATANLSHQLSRGLHLIGSVGWLDITDDVAGHTQGIEENVELRWRYRQFDFYMQVRNSSMKTDFENQTFQLIQIGARREF